MTALSDLLNEHKGDRSVRQIGRACAKYGVGESTVIPYFNGKHGTNPPEEVLHALSQVMPLDIARLREAAGVPRGENEPYVAPAEFNRLSHGQRAALDEFVRSFVGPQGANHVDSSTPSDPSPPRASDEARPPQEVSRYYVVKMMNGPWVGREMIVSKRDVDTRPPWVELEVLQELPPGTLVEPSGDEPVRLVIQLYKSDGKTPDGPPRAVTASRYKQLVPYGTKVDVLWPVEASTDDPESDPLTGLGRVFGVDEVEKGDHGDKETG